MRLRELRRKSKKTQQEIASILHCDQSLYSKYERNEREVPLWILIKLSFLYNTSIDFMVGLTDESNHYPRNHHSEQLSSDFTKKS